MFCVLLSQDVWALVVGFGELVGSGVAGVFLFLFYGLQCLRQSGQQLHGKVQSPGVRPTLPCGVSEAHFHRKVLCGSLLAMVDATSDRWPFIRFINASRVLMPVSDGHSTTTVVWAGSGCSVSVRSSGPTCMVVSFVSA